ncbi:putative tRNA (cytidine(34)-2'-O)-methyltransferase [Salvia splendens]|uniref:putative tRNA (cytidine(34)-2'-O)-methyltransferase n=1 Tax=Salvia splendens TaxID=180675 RepID=UPI001C26ECEC|nr:putative tRNA (cytidine(34)-2'-O)-methyltransferase [Salvia splendens]
MIRKRAAIYCWRMDATGLRALTSSSRHLLRLSSKAPPPLRRRPSPRVSSLSLRYVTSERCRAHALSDGCGAAVAAASVSSKKEFLQVVLMSPQIPGNTGSIARTCAASAVKLHLIEPLGFQVDDVKLKRAGLDYWPYVVVKVHSSWPEFREYFKKQEGEKRLLAFTKRGINIHSEFTYRKGDWLVFGSETSGLPAEALDDCMSEPLGGGTIRIPMIETYVRCLNLSVSVGIALYEACRQLNYEQFHNPSEPCLNETLFLTEDMFA